MNKITFKEFLFEDTGDLDSICDSIKKDCQIFLNDTHYPLMRGIKNPKDGDGMPQNIPLFNKRSIRMDRKPRNSDSDPFFNWSFNASIEKLYSIKNIRQSGLFTTGYEKFALYYGGIGFIFPIGKYNFIWGKEVEDSYEDVPSLLKMMRDQGIQTKKAATLDKYFQTLINVENYDFDVIKNPQIRDPDLKNLVMGIHTHFLDEMTKDLGYTLNQDLDMAIQAMKEIIFAGPMDYYIIGANNLAKALGMRKTADIDDIYSKFLEKILEK